MCCWTRRRWCSAQRLALGVALLACEAFGQLSADELLLIYNSRSAESRNLAEHYAQVRGVPADRLLGLGLRAGEQIGRRRYEAQIAEVVRAYLQDQGRAKQVRCLVCFYEVPFRVMGFRPTQAEREAQRGLKEQINEACRALSALNRQLALLMSGASRPATRRATQTVQPQQILDEYVRARERARRWLGRATEGPHTEQARQKLMLIIQRAEGGAGFVDRLRASEATLSDEQREMLAGQEAAMRAARAEARRLLAAGPASEHLQEGIRVLARVEGLSGVIRFLEAWQGSLDGGKMTIAAVDSELAMLWHGRFPLQGWLPNPLYTHRFAGRADPADPPTLFVSRLDGPSPAVVRRMIDDAAAVERSGLTGRVYVDARGLAGGSAYARTDEDLLALARRVSGADGMEVVLDTHQSVFPLGGCPRAALYCGWYSHKQYVPAFEFVPGAVGYHIASSEAVSLRTSKGYWCPHLLRAGCAATLGAVREPYLLSFPSAEEFFALLLCGRFTLAECYGYTQPCHSWMMMLLGDPLYRPFAAKPVLDADAVISELRRVSLLRAGEGDG